MLNESPNVLIGGVNLQATNFDYEVQELAELVKANGMTVVGEIFQNLEHINAGTYFGVGKIDEIKGLAAEKNAEFLVLNDELTPAQMSNLDQALPDVKIMDRTGLILAIFANRAHSREAQLQVQIAQLRYRLPRLRVGGQANLMQQGGGPGFANRGSGETKLELNQRTIKHHIAQIRKELAQLDVAQATKRKQRDKQELPTVALVGYTNAGKSTTMNGLLQLFDEAPSKQVFEKDMLFATLDTSVREIHLPNHQKFLLSDTVGFVSKLPTQLIKAFRSTLAEAAQADLLVQVIDYSDPNYEQMVQVTEQTLAELDIHDIPMIYAYNKADLRPNTKFPQVNSEHDLIYSANDPASLQQLSDLIAKLLFADHQVLTYLIPYADGKWVDYLNEHANVQSQDYDATGTKIVASVTPIDAQRLAQFEVTD